MDPPNDILDQGSITKTDDSIDYKDEILKILNIINILPKTYSNYLKVRETLNSIVIKIIEDDDYTSFTSLLFKGYKLDVLNEKRQSALHYAFFRGSHAIIRAYLLHWQPFKNDSLDWADSNGLTHLHIVCNQCHMNVLEIIKIYLKNGSDVNARYHSDPTNKNCGSTPLHFAMKKDIFDVVILLLENGADINAANANGTTPFHVACQLTFIRGQDIDLYINIFHADIGAKDDRGDTPLLSVFDDYDQPLFFLIIQAKEKFDVLIRNGANILAKNNNGDSVLHLLIKTLKLDHCHTYLPSISLDDTKHAELVEEILKSSKELLVMKNNEGKTPLQLAVLMTSASIVKVLLNHKADTKALKIAGEHDRIFCYPPLVPNFDIVQNIMNIIDLLANEEFEFSLEDHLMIIKFLVHEADVCRCSIKHDVGYKDNLFTVIHLGSGIHATQVLSEMRENGLSLIDGGNHLLCYLLLMKEANFYMDKELEEILISCPCTGSFVLSERAEKELAILKSDIKLKNGVMLYDLMLQHPFKASRLLKDDNFDRKKIIHNFELLKNIILGFVTKAIIRNYIVKRAYEFFPFTPLSVLPALCFEMVLSYLSNLDIFNLCASASLPESNNVISNLFTL